MMNIIRADIYRITLNMGIIATFIGAAFSAVIMIVLLHVLGDEEFILTGANSALPLFQISDFAILFVLPIFTIVAAPIFRDGTAKNEVAWGISRLTLYLTRLLIITVVVVLLRIVLFVFAMLTGTIINGFGDVAPGFWLEFSQIFGMQLLLFIAASWLGVFIVFTIQNAYAVIEMWAGLLFLPFMITGMLEQLDIAPGFVYFVRSIDLLQAINALADFSELGANDILRILAIAAFWLIIPTAAGVKMFQVKAIK